MTSKQLRKRNKHLRKPRFFGKTRRVWNWFFTNYRGEKVGLLGLVANVAFIAFLLLLMYSLG